MFEELNYYNYDIMLSNNRGSEQFFRLHRKNRDITKPLNYKRYISIIAGSNEHVYKGRNISYVQKRLSERFKNANLQFYVIPNSTHDYKEHEKEMSKLIIDSIKKMK